MQLPDGCVRFFTQTLNRTMKVVTSLACVFTLVFSSLEAIAQEVSFSRDIRPLLSDRCFACHGPDENARESDLRLDMRAEAVRHAIVPGDPERSILVQRLSTEDNDERMPPVDSHQKPLSADEIELIRRWIDQGADYSIHWAYRGPLRPRVPRIEDHKWVRNPIDAFISRRLKRESLTPSAEADPRTLVRRLSFDLSGLPPSYADVLAFADDHSEANYEMLVDQLLQSKHFGERMAMYWLDVVRYADTNGIHGDNHRDHAPFRDYVIKAFNDNKPYNDFIVEQIAGDLLPEPTHEQRIASGFNRLNMTTREGGAQPKEYVAIYQADRVRNTGSIFLGSTFGCAQCHDHKFDPFTMRDFYSFAAFFSDIKETPVGVQKPIQLPRIIHDDDSKRRARLKKLSHQIERLSNKLEVSSRELEESQKKWEHRVRNASNDATTSDSDKPQPDDIPAPVLAIIQTPEKQRTEEQAVEVARFFRSIAPSLEPTRNQLAAKKEEYDSLAAMMPILVSQSVKPRPVRILPRGNWLDESGDVVSPDTPGFMPSWVDAANESPAESERATRMDLARWLASAKNPLVARVYVNRLWKLLFGHGLVRTLDDFGAQGDLPSHAELLDWLATEFIARGWDTKAILKLIAMSSTYRQSSRIDADMLNIDPRNDLFARQSRFRFDAETIRDNALAVSGLLVKTIGGPSVKPYQPVGYWAHLNFPKRKYRHDSDENQYRRGLYTYWCRTFLHPSLRAFDAPTREECTVDRPRSNTPLAALVLLNDPTYVEAARALAERILSDSHSEFDDRLALAFKFCLQRTPSPIEQKILRRLYENDLREYQENKEAAQQVQTVGLKDISPNARAEELAAWISVTRTILNLHEIISRN